MVKLISRVACALAVLLACGSQLPAEFVRKNAIVEAVNKTKDSIVTLKVTRDDGWSKREIVGTGVVIDERGFVVTNHHVVKDAVKIVAIMADKTKFEPTVYASAPKSDLAILRLPTKDKVKALPLAAANDLMVGETVIAVGNPYGFTNTVSTGIISALDREIPMAGETLTGLIQHSININPGNSGGPLLNINGELIGINVALREGAQGISFALNAETVKDTLVRHLSAQKISKVVHGLSITESVASEGRDRQKVVLEKGPTDSGLRKGDVLMKVGNLALQNRFDVERAFWGYKAGDKIQAVVLRAGKETTCAITLASCETARANP